MLLTRAECGRQLKRIVEAYEQTLIGLITRKVALSRIGGVLVAALGTSQPPSRPGLRSTPVLAISGDWRSDVLSILFVREARCIDMRRLVLDCIDTKNSLSWVLDTQGSIQRAFPITSGDSCGRRV
jgi:hypothetical protein